MKTIRRITGTAILATLAIVAVQSASAKDIKNWPGWMKPKPTQQSSLTPASSATAMDCSKCTTVTVVARRDVVPGRSGHGFTYVSQAVHQCDGCRDVLGRKSGTKEMELAHNCTAADQKAMCCDTSRADRHGA
jgi:hypothetical protein